MKKLLKLLAVALIFISALALTGCKDQYSVYVFTSTGGHITINDSNDKISLKEILYYNKNVNLTFNAHENEGYQFLYWLKDTQVYSTDKSLTLNISQETVIKAMFEKSDSLSITFIDENNKLLTENPLIIQQNEVMKNFPAIPVKDGYIGNFYCGEEKMVEGKKYPYSTSKTFVLKYIKEEFTVSVKYKDCTKNDLTVNLLTESWSVDYNSEVKFSITNNTKREYKVYLNTTSNEIYANAYGVYTVSNISSDMTVIVKLLPNTLLSDDTNQNNKDDEDNTTSDKDNNQSDENITEDTNNKNENTNNQNNNNGNQNNNTSQENNNSNTNNEDINTSTSSSIKNKYSITFDKNQMPSLVKINIKTSSKNYEYKQSKYYVNKNSSFIFDVEDQNGFVVSNRIVYANGEIVPFIDGVYTLKNINENITIAIDHYYTMVFTIDYGKLGHEYYEDKMDGDIVPFYDAVIELHHSRLTNYCSKLDPKKDIITFFVNDTIKKMTLVEFIKYANSSVEDDYKVSSVNLTTTKGSLISRDWLKISYKNSTPTIDIQNKHYFHNSIYNLQLIWE